MENQRNLTKPGRNFFPWDDRDRNWQKWRKKQKKSTENRNRKNNGWKWQSSTSVSSNWFWHSVNSWTETEQTKSHNSILYGHKCRLDGGLFFSINKRIGKKITPIKYNIPLLNSNLLLTVTILCCHIKILIVKGDFVYSKSYCPFVNQHWHFLSLQRKEKYVF